MTTPEKKPEPVLGPRNLGTLVDRGWQLFVQNNFTEAENTFRQALALDTHALEAHYGLGVCLKKLGKADAARKSFEQALKSQPTSDKERDYVSIIRHLLAWYTHPAAQSDEV